MVLSSFPLCLPLLFSYDRLQKVASMMENCRSFTLAQLMNMTEHEFLALQLGVAPSPALV